MAKSNAFTVVKLKSLPAGKHCDGQGLWFHKRADGGAQWVFRFQLWGGQERWDLDLSRMSLWLRPVGKRIGRVNRCSLISIRSNSAV
ncbi:hypothetical protein RA2_03242 [Roseovarius sp. A-2]|nr:hypothetical protein RA2_03242 [Roseovarius sp. A-2]